MTRRILRSKARYSRSLNYTCSCGHCYYPLAPLILQVLKSPPWFALKLKAAMESRKDGREPRGADLRFRKASISILGQPHRDAVARALSRVLSTEIAEITYAQIVDGLPLLEVLKDVYGDLICPDHPIHQHKQLKEGTIETVRRFRDDFDPEIIQFDVPVSYWRFIPQSPGSLTCAQPLMCTKSSCQNSRPPLSAPWPSTRG